MISITKILRRCFGGILCLSPSFVYAAANVSGSLPTIFGSDAVSNRTDLSISYLSELLGSVGNVLQGTGGQMLGKMFYQFNAGILVVAGIWLAYTVATLVIKSAHIGSFVSQQQNHLLVFLRIAVGFAMLFPSPITGYSIFQDVVAKVVVYGVKLADETWDRAIDYLNEGGLLYQQQITSGKKKFLPLGKFSNKDKDGPSLTVKSIQKLLSCAVCMHQSDQVRGEHYGIQLDEKNKRLLFPGPDNKPGKELTNPQCGSVDYNVSIALDDVHKEIINGHMRNAMYQIMATIDPIAKDIAAKFKSVNLSENEGFQFAPRSISMDTLNDSVPDSLTNGALAYIGTGLPILNVAVAGSKGDKSKKYLQVINDQKKYGWAMAGLLNWSLIAYNYYLNESDNRKSTLPKIDGRVIAPKFDEIGNRNFSEASQYVSGKDFKFEAYYKLKQEFLTRADSTSRMTGKFESSSPSSFLGKILYVFYHSIANVFEDLITVNANPLIWMHKLGVDAIKASSSMIIDYLIVIVGLGFALGMVPFVSLSGVVTAASGFLKGFVSPFLLIFVAGGVVIGFYLPLYPYFLFMLGVIGWCILVFEAMVAAPLVMLGLTHPEGHDFLGKAEQALILLLGVFLRPVLMIIGLVAGIILSYVALRMLMHGVYDIFSEITGLIIGSPFGGFSMNTSSFDPVQMGGQVLGMLFNKFGILLTPIMIIVIDLIFIMIAYQLVIKCYSLIFVLTNNVLRWIGAFERPDDSAQAAEQVRGIAMHSGFHAARGVGENIGKAGDSLAKSFAPKDSGGGDEGK